MRLFIKIIPLRAGTSEPAEQPIIFDCPADVEPDTILSFLTQQLGEVIETIWTSTERHERIDTGWVFPAPGAAGPQDAVEIACVPLIQTAEGLQPMFEAQADQRQALGQLAASRAMDYTIIQRPQRAYQPTRQGTAEARHQPARPDNPDQAMADIARQADATLTSYPRPGAAARRIVLQDERDDRGNRYQVAALDEHGILTITGRDQGPGVSEFFGSGITCYEWVYVVAPDRVPPSPGSWPTTTSTTCSRSSPTTTSARTDSSATS